MAQPPYGLSLRRSTSQPGRNGLATLALAIVLFLGISLARLGDANDSGGEALLYMVPVGVLALRFGLRGGLAGAVVGFLFVVAWDRLHQHVALGVVGYLNRGLAFVIVGVIVGVFVDRRRRLEADLSHSFEESLDLLWTADSTGTLIRVNPAWQRALGRTNETMRSRPLTDFVHVDDRQATIAELIALAGGLRDSIGSRSRFQTADGSYRWLEWSAHACASDGVIHGVAHDITVQRQAELRLANNAKRLETKITERTRDLNEARAETLQLLAVASEYRDDETFQHTERVGALAGEIATSLGLSEESVALLREAAPLHDIGKLAIPDRILLKPKRLTPAERAVMEAHTTLGARLLFGSRSPVLQLAGVIAESHHERWDGTGYPKGLVAEAIPLVGRIVAVADVHDALTHERPYKPAWPIEQAVALIRRSAGTQFDPRVVAAFLTAREQHSTRFLEPQAITEHTDTARSQRLQHTPSTADTGAAARNR
jgi:PAS domain S-box-containing protein/putative nucleotidyltransferase with HDIG domain